MAFNYYPPLTAHIDIVSVSGYHALNSDLLISILVKDVPDSFKMHCKELFTKILEKGLDDDLLSPNDFEIMVKVRQINW